MARDLFSALIPNESWVQNMLKQMNAVEMGEVVGGWECSDTVNTLTSIYGGVVAGAVGFYASIATTPLGGAMIGGAAGGAAYGLANGMADEIFCSKKKK